MKINHQILSDFQSLESWEEKYEYIIGLARKLEPYSDELKKPEFLIRGCQSRTWLHPQRLENNAVHWLAYSDSLFVRGLIYILLLDFQDRSLEELQTIQPTTLQTLELEKYITAGRRNGLGEMIVRLQGYTEM
jgi:cysteine desulfuration protein SufE